MSRQIICLKCRENRTQGIHDSEDAGWTERVLFLSNSRTPPSHGMVIGDVGQEVFYPISELRCDLCNEDITGQIVVAVSRIPPEREMRPWEHEYGKIMTAEEVETYRKLAAL